MAKSQFKYAFLETGFFRLLVISNQNSITEIRFVKPGNINRILRDIENKNPGTILKNDPAALAGPLNELKDYFAGRLRKFKSPIDPQGTPFQKKVWKELLRIPYGESASYGEVAAKIGNPKACRAVGMANNKNPIPVIIPCHRVIGKDGSLVGYGSGIGIKRRMLEIEKTSSAEDPR